MVRPVTADFLHSMRFHALILNGNQDFLVPKAPITDTWPDGVAGFTSCSLPELTVETVEYKEGSWIFTRKYPANPTVSDVSLQRGVSKTDISFWYWAQTAATGNEYRVDLQINHYHRDNTFVGGGITNFKANDTTPGRIYILHEAFAIRCKPAGDLDATSGEISIAELDVAVEYFDVRDGSGAVIPPMVAPTP